MEVIKENLTNLVAAIKNSEEYRDYLEARAEVEKDSKKKRNLDKYRTKLYELQNSSSGTELYQSIDRIEQESEQFRADPVVDRFLAAELALCRIVQEINWTLIEALDFDMEFIKD